ncbi:MAG: type II toxin-antitoxin system VapC family toxin [Candidatus Binatus sp.]|uniref:type II toxin-antitoxin system VapC family toxin n=1 Tax=Candidatus Binatus sp. TaxID=2811406 RepID=UPI002721EA34|nr:type II toxin-antitoxin system VapC family toxin [Candidatus Binatus sp.]MDO8434926.1 type II toxin-antitoxin system VapC family toxin [Candidatus Binatus sp.]
MKFWDSSALVPLFNAEPRTADAESWLRSDPDITIWCLTRVEVLSALSRRRREFALSDNEYNIARNELGFASPNWFQVTDFERVRIEAERIVSVHPLRAADALQLGAALVAADGEPETLELVTLDRRLADAARRERFPVLGVR